MAKGKIAQEELSIFFIKVSKMSLLQTESYLRNRHWHPASRANLRESLLYILKNLPKVVFIPADHPNKRLKHLPLILKNTYPCRIVGYTDSHMPSSMAHIHELGAELAVLPPISGPAVERILHRIQHEWDPVEMDSSKLHLAASRLGAISTQLIHHKMEDRGDTGASPDYSIDEAGQALSQLLESDLAPIKQALHNSLVLQGTQRALAESTRKSPAGAPASKIQKVSECVCITIDSDRFKGYLVAAMGEAKFDLSFIEKVKLKLLSFLSAHGEKIENESSFEVKMQEVDFEPWAVEQAEFLKKSIHGNQEIAMAFFPTQTVHLRKNTTDEGEMFEVELSEIADNETLDFDLYLFLPANSKFLLYTAQGRSLLTEQKNRLLQRGIAHMHLRQESVGAVRRYRAEKFLNSRINEFKNLKKQNPSAKEI